MDSALRRGACGLLGGAAKRGDLPWVEVAAWSEELHRDFKRALAETKLPKRPDYEAANRFPIKARREMASR